MQNIVLILTRIDFKTFYSVRHISCYLISYCVNPGIATTIL
nr:MAG TPA: hypothetical protein [Caudoviricetes sp.]